LPNSTSSFIFTMPIHGTSRWGPGGDEDPPTPESSINTPKDPAERRSRSGKKNEDVEIKGKADSPGMDVKNLLVNRFAYNAPSKSATSEPAAPRVDRTIHSTLTSSAADSPLLPLKTTRIKPTGPSPMTQWGGRIIAGYGAAAPKQSKRQNAFPGATTTPKDYFSVPLGKAPSTPTSQLRWSSKGVTEDDKKAEGPDEGTEKVGKAMEAWLKRTVRKHSREGISASAMEEEVNLKMLMTEAEGTAEDLLLEDVLASGMGKKIGPETLTIEPKETVGDVGPKNISVPGIKDTIKSKPKAKEWLGNVGLEGVYASIRQVPPPSTTHLRLPPPHAPIAASQAKEVCTSPPAPVPTEEVNAVMQSVLAKNELPTPALSSGSAQGPDCAASAPAPTTSTRPIQRILQPLDDTKFCIPPQGLLTDVEYSFLITKLRGKEIRMQEWDSAVAWVRDVSFGHEPGSSKEPVGQVAVDGVQDRSRTMGLEVLTQELGNTQEHLKHMAIAVQKQKRLVKELAQKLGSTQGTGKHVVTEDVQGQQDCVLGGGAQDIGCSEQGRVRHGAGKDGAQELSPNVIPIVQVSTENAVLEDAQEARDHVLAEEIQEQPDGVLSREDQEVQEVLGGEQEVIQDVARDSGDQEMVPSMVSIVRASTEGAVSGPVKQPYRVLIPIPEDSDEEL
jgi:hypothetical protein